MGPRELIAACLKQPALRSLLVYTVQVVGQLGAHSSRNETLRWLYTSTVWYLAGPRTAYAYVKLLLIPQVLGTAVSGIPGISQVTIHREPGGEWYASTEGSNLIALYAREGPSPPILINRKRCLTTNILEVHECLGLEAVCWLFSVFVWMR